MPQYANGRVASQPIPLRGSMADLQDLLLKTSRTFALSIPLLEEPTRGEVTVAYLLFRIADTFEDAWEWPKELRVGALEEFGGFLSDPTSPRIAESVRSWTAVSASDHAGYQELLEKSPEVLEAFAALSPEARESIAEHTRRTCEGMARFVERADSRGRLELRSLDELREYCYVVAGIVGEMLTELFLLGSAKLTAAAARLRSRARSFGEALQLVNILKDAAADAGEGRSFLPRQNDTARVFELARADLLVAGEYVRILQEEGAPRGTVAFTALPVQLAWATLECVEVQGPGAKVSRQQVMAIVTELDRALDRDSLPPVLSTP